MQSVFLHSSVNQMRWTMLPAINRNPLSIHSQQYLESAQNFAVPSVYRTTPIFTPIFF